jgi:hypothetical protein
VTNLLSKEETINTYCSTWTKVAVGKGKKKKEEKIREVPKRPKPSPLLTQAENHYIDSVAKNVFKEVVPEDTDWALLISKHGFNLIKDKLRANYSDRRLFRQSYARITTSRLKDFRKLKPDLRYKKKKDVTGVDLDALIQSRTSRAASFANEVVFLDQQFKGSLLYYRVEVTKGNRTVLDIPASKLRIAEDIERLGIYSDTPERPTSESDFVIVEDTTLPPLVMEKSKQGVKKKAKKAMPHPGPPLENKPETDVSIYMEDDRVMKKSQVWSGPDQTYHENIVNITGSPEALRFVDEMIKRLGEHEMSSEDEEEAGPSTRENPSERISKQIKLDLIEHDLEKINLKTIKSNWDIWFPATEWTPGKESLNTVETLKKIEKYMKQLYPSVYDLLPTATGKWFKERDFKAFTEKEISPVLSKFKKESLDTAQTAIYESLSKLATDTNVVSALATLRN